MALGIIQKDPQKPHVLSTEGGLWGSGHGGGSGFTASGRGGPGQAFRA